MKKISLAIIIAVFSISLVACGNSGGASNSNTDGKTTEYDNNIDQDSNQNNNEPNTKNNTQSNVNSTVDVSIDKAKEIALSHAGLTSDQVTFKRTELDFDDGVQKYEVEFIYNNKEYSYEIDATTGKVISYEQD